MPRSVDAEFTKAVKQVLSQRTGLHCSNPKCRRPTAGPHEDSGKATNLGQAAHIAAVSEGGPRFDVSQTAEQLRSAENGIWLCAGCHSLVDRDPGTYTVGVLKGWKRETEQWARERIEQAGGEVARRIFLGVPHRNSHFTGRDELLARLHARLQEEHATALAQAAIHGMGGIGKTQTAIEYAYRFAVDEPYYRSVFWVTAETETEIGRSYQAIARELELVDAQTELDAVIQAVRHWLAQADDWLLVFDNADDPAILRDFLPQIRAGGKVLLTSRAKSFRSVGVGEPFRVEILTPEDSAQLLLTRSKRNESNAASELARELGYLPLALEQAAAYVEQVGVNLTEYLASFRRRGLKLFKIKEFAPPDYEKTVATTWSVSIEAVAKESLGSAELLNAAAFLVPDSIPIEIFTLGGSEFGGMLAAALEGVDEDPLLFWELLEPLERYSLVERLPENAFKLHRLTQEVVKEALGDQQKDWAEGVVKAINAAYPLVKFENWAGCERLHVNAVSALKLIRDVQIEATGAVNLLSRSGEFALRRGEHLISQASFELEIEIRGRMQGAEHPDTLTSMNNLAATLGALGDLAGARRLHEKTLEIRECVLGAEHPDTLTSMNNLAGTLVDLGDLARARRLHENAHEIRGRVLGTSHPSTLTSMNNLALILSARDDLTGARRLNEKTLEIRERVLGAEHPDTLTSMNNLAATLRALDDLYGARRLQEKTLEIRERVLGAEHPDTLTSMNNLASYHWKLGFAEDAKALFERTYETRERVLGPEHPNTTTTANWLLIIAQEENAPAATTRWLGKLRWLADRAEDAISSADQRKHRVHVLKVLEKLEPNPSS